MKLLLVVFVCGAALGQVFRPARAEDIDDGARVYLNGILVTNVRLSSIATYSTFATSSPASGSWI